MNAVIGTILENLRAINLVAQPTVDVFKGDRSNTGDSKEISVNDFISSYLPADFQVKKGKIYSKESSSNNIDCVVLAPSHPRLFTPVREVILAEGVYAAIEVKPDISVITDNSELMRGLIQIKSAKDLKRDSQYNKYHDGSSKPEAFYKIPSVLFAFRSGDIEKTVNFILDKMRNNILGTEDIPDVIITLDKGIIFYTPHLSHSSLGNILNKNLEVKKLYGEEVFIYWQSDKQEYTLVLFLLMFLNFIPPTILSDKFIIQDYLKIDGAFKRRVFPVNSIVEKSNQAINLFLLALQENQETLSEIEPEILQNLKILIETLKDSEMGKLNHELFLSYSKNLK